MSSKGTQLLGMLGWLLVVLHVSNQPLLHMATVGHSRAGGHAALGTRNVCVVMCRIHGKLQVHMCGASQALELANPGQLLHLADFQVGKSGRQNTERLSAIARLDPSPLDLALKSAHCRTQQFASIDFQILNLLGVRTAE